MCKQGEQCCCVVHNHYYNSEQQCDQTPPQDSCNSIEYGELQHFKGQAGTDPCIWEVGDLGQGFLDGVFGLYLLTVINADGTKDWKAVRQSNDATL